MFRPICLLLLALPLQAADFAITSYSRSPTNFSLTFPTSAGNIYGVERADDLGTWAVQTIYCGTGADITFTQPLRPRAAFYRVSARNSPPLALAPAGPTLTSGAVSLPDATVGQSYAAEISACPSGTAPFAFQVSGAPPAGLTLQITADTVQVRGSATTAARAQFQITVTDAASATVTKTYDLRAVNPPPEIVTDFISLKAGAAANVSLSASGGSGSLSWSIDSGSLPDGTSLSSAGLLTGTPSAAAAELDETGLHSAILRVTDQHTDRITGAPTPRSTTGTVTCGVRLSYNLNIFAQRPNGPSLTSRFCTACHNEFFTPHITSDARTIIGAPSNPSSSCPDRVYITPGQPEQSLIYKKLTAPECGDRMPQGGPYLTEVESNRVLRWILELQPDDAD